MQRAKTMQRFEAGAHDAVGAARTSTLRARVTAALSVVAVASACAPAIGADTEPTSGDSGVTDGGDVGSETAAGDGDDAGDGDGDGDGNVFVGDGDGTIECEDPDVDTDSDTIPDCDDPFPNDPDFPGIGRDDVIYAHTASELFTMDPAPPYTIASVGAFTFDEFAADITDIALDEYGVLYAISFQNIFACDPATAACRHVAFLTDAFNGLTVLPTGTANPDAQTIVGIAGSGDWYAIDIGDQEAAIQMHGSYGMGLSNAGDVFSIENVGTYGATDPAGVWACDPSNGAATTMVAPLTGYDCVWGLAGWDDAIYAFNCGGQIVQIDPMTGGTTEIAVAPHEWWGAGVRTAIGN
jgi:hypothetical protein